MSRKASFEHLVVPGEGGGGKEREGVEQGARERGGKQEKEREGGEEEKERGRKLGGREGEEELETIRKREREKEGRGRIVYPESMLRVRVSLP